MCVADASCSSFEASETPEDVGGLMVRANVALARAGFRTFDEKVEQRLVELANSSHVRSTE